MFDIAGEMAPDDLVDLLEAAEDLESQLGVEPGLILRELTHMLKKQAEFGRLRDRFDNRVIRQ